MATSERTALARKATGLKDAVKQAEGQLGELQVEQEGSGCPKTVIANLGAMACG